MTFVTSAVGAARTVVNVGAGTGSYEPSGARVVAIDPSEVMLRQRPTRAAPALRARAEHLPIRDQAVDVAMAVLTVHHWTAWRAGIEEMRRVAPKQVIIAYDPQLHCDFWLVREYIPEVARLELGRPSADDIANQLEAITVTTLPVPWDFADGVFPAHWRRPEAYLDERVRRNCSALAQTDPAAVSRGIHRLRRDLESGRWHEQHRELLAAEELDAGFRLIVGGSD
ncbi:MAG: class I SAM-dependent methyltransferase [Actinomycetes bacterium]